MSYEVLEARPRRICERNPSSCATGSRLPARVAREGFRRTGEMLCPFVALPLADKLRRQNDIECSGSNCSDAAEILDLMRADLPLLREARAVTEASRVRGDKVMS